MHSADLSGELCYISLRVTTYLNYLIFFCMGDLSVLVHLLMCSVIYLYQYGFVNIYFILLVIIQSYLYVNSA